MCVKSDKGGGETIIWYQFSFFKLTHFQYAFLQQIIARLSNNKNQERRVNDREEDL